MNIRALVAVMLGLAIAGGCASGTTVEDGPERAMQRLPAGVKAAAEGYVEALHGAATALAKVTDTASARAAMPGLEAQLVELTKEWRVLEGLDERKQADARYAMYRSLASADRRFDAQVSRVKGTPGVGSVLAPLLDKIPRWR
jgi:hypothetical protein